MIKRFTLVEQFSTFILWEDSCFGHWRSDPRLQRNISQYLEQDSTLTSPQWAIFLHSRLDKMDQNRGLQARQSREHLYAYLQEPCYQAAFGIWSTYQNYSKEYAIADYFQCGVLRFDKLLSSFNAQLSPNLGSYAVHFLKWRITDTLRELHKGWGHTSWSLLLYRSKLCVKNALIRYGILGELLEDYLLAWECYVEIYKPVKRVRDGSVQEPSIQDWQTITAAYRSMAATRKEINEIKKWISDCGKAVSNYISLNPISTNIIGTHETEDLESRLSNDSQAEELDVACIVDYQQTHQQICIWLNEEIEQLSNGKARLNPNFREILELYYRQGIKQTAIGKQLGINQATVARNLQKIKEILTEKFIQWSAENLSIALKSSDVEGMSQVFEEWIQYYYQNMAREI